MRYVSTRVRSLTACAFVAAALWVAFSSGVRYGETLPKVVLIRGVENIEPFDLAATSSADFATFWEAWELIDENYLKAEGVSAQEKVYGAVRGLVKSLDDPNSEFYTPEDDKRFQEDIKGNFGGIGAEIGLRKNQLVIVAPLKNTPAMRAGLRAGDHILRINATSTDGLSVDQAVRLIRGPQGTEVTLTIFRDEWEKAEEIKIVRGTIIVPTLDYEIREGDIAHVELHSFNANAARLFHEAMLKAVFSGAKGLVLDLRNDPGGYLDVAVDLAGWFFPRGTLVVSEAGRAGVGAEFRAQGSAALADFPVVVIINEGSASASEILAGALRDVRKIKLVGEKSFGKGTVQQLLTLSDGSSLKITIAHWVLPSGKVLDDNGGLEPDVPVEMTEEDIKNDRDPQLEKAIEVLRQEMAQR